MILGLAQGFGWATETFSQEPTFQEVGAFREWAVQTTGWQIGYTALGERGGGPPFEMLAWSADALPDTASTIRYTSSQLANRSYQSVLAELVAKLASGAKPLPIAPKVRPLTVTPAQVAAGEGPAVIAAQLTVQPTILPSITATSQLQTAAALAPTGIGDWLGSHTTLLLAAAAGVALFLMMKGKG